MAIVETVYLYGILAAAYLAAFVSFFREGWNWPESKEARVAGTRRDRLRNFAGIIMFALWVPCLPVVFLGKVGLDLIRGDLYAVAVCLAIPVSFVIWLLVKRFLPKQYSWFQNDDINSLPVWIWVLAAIGIFVLLGRDPW